VKRLVVAYVCGVIFALGLGVSGMTHPSKVLAFLDFTGAWDPSLALVMGSGVLVNAVFFRIATRRGAPLLASSFALPERTAIDASLVGGAALFGVGWGLGGFCPGPAIVSVVTGATPVVVFVVAMLLAMGIFDALEKSARSAAIEKPV
jgi:uncharacterized membrane protein YedE/YeeE